MTVARSVFVILSEAKNPFAGVQTLRFTQGDMPCFVFF